MNLYFSGTYFARDATYAHNYCSRNGLVNLGSVGGSRSIFRHMLRSSFNLPVQYNNPQPTASNSSSFFPSLNPYILAHGQQQSGFQFGSAHNSSVGQQQQSGFQFGSAHNSNVGQQQQSGFQFGSAHNSNVGQQQQSGFQFGSAHNSNVGQQQQSGFQFGSAHNSNVGQQQQSGFQFGSAHNSNVGQQQQFGFQFGNTSNTVSGQSQPSGFQFDTSNTGQQQQSGFQFGNASNTVSGQPQQPGFQFGNTSNTGTGQPQQPGFQFGNSSSVNSIQPQQPGFQCGSGQKGIAPCPGRSPGSPFGCPFCKEEFWKGCPYRSGAGNQPNSEADFMFVGRVLVGRICRGHPSMRRPPNDESDPQKRPCHTAINSTGQPTIFVIFESAQCYPEYLIEYRNQ